jgi:hypothetical protein
MKNLSQRGREGLHGADRRGLGQNRLGCFIRRRQSVERFGGNSGGGRSLGASRAGDAIALFARQ